MEWACLEPTPRELQRQSQIANGIQMHTHLPASEPSKCKGQGCKLRAADVTIGAV